LEQLDYREQLELELLELQEFLETMEPLEALAHKVPQVLPESLEVKVRRVQLDQLVLMVQLEQLA
jgi:hypothetical protein